MSEETAFIARNRKGVHPINFHGIGRKVEE